MALGNEFNDSCTSESSIRFIGAVYSNTDGYKMAMDIGSREVVLYAWSRTDIGSQTLRTTLRGGPAWSSVVYRITSDAGSGEVLLCEHADDIPRKHSLVS